ncbi:hypothetical protein [Brevundimonas guildfordensis]|uniref:TetR family transcriptional regulator n=1 Tax=Brevundimonas guildfordensis TaxID=2762241 RepID=A0ABR8R3X0_9CAUL|nr:hypothetical protein [Brevundimonas guildfordensis]MBD7942483.1 hypothetical protein [Brevundimonas guildfordensis]
MIAREFPLPPYGLEKAIRHGAAIERLMTEREQGVGEFADHSLASALAFDAADFVWAALMLHVPGAQQSREVRNMVAEAIQQALMRWGEIPSEGPAE